MSSDVVFESKSFTVKPKKGFVQKTAVVPKTVRPTFTETLAEYNVTNYEDNVKELVAALKKSNIAPQEEIEEAPVQTVQPVAKVKIYKNSNREDQEFASKFKESHMRVIHNFRSVYGEIPIQIKNPETNLAKKDCFRASVKTKTVMRKGDSRAKRLLPYRFKQTQRIYLTSPLLSKNAKKKPLMSKAKRLGGVEKGPEMAQTDEFEKVPQKSNVLVDSIFESESLSMITSSMIEKYLLNQNDLNLSDTELNYLNGIFEMNENSTMKAYSVFLAAAKVINRMEDPYRQAIHAANVDDIKMQALEFKLVGFNISEIQGSLY
jgi:hypothetical protein